MEQTHQYLVECFKCSYDEMKFRIRHRDAWLKTHLLAQFVIAAMASGVNVKLVESTDALPIMLSLSLPVSLVILIFYLIEENTISSLSRYLAGLSKVESEITSGAIIYNFDSSEVVTTFFKDTQKMRVFAQFISFLVIPLLLFFAPMREIKTLSYFELAINFVLSVSIVFLIIRAHINRQHKLNERVEVN
ncbi:MAG: hypothetical protein V3U87_08615 [Methylococcaceae bacterium]